MRIVAIQYYNVIFYLKVQSEREQSMFEFLKKRIIDGEPMYMVDIAKWCKEHGIEYMDKFRYRKDYSVFSNIWNFYSYLRFRIANKYIL